MPRRDAPVDDEKKSYAVVWFFTALLMFILALYALADDNVFRRAWKKYQAGFNRLEISTIEKQIGAEQERLNADPEYQEAMKTLAEAQASLTSGEAVKQKAALLKELEAAQHDDLTKDLNLRFIKSNLEELRFLFDDAEHKGRKEEAEALLKRIEEGEKERAEKQKKYSESQAHIEEIENRVKQLEGAAKAAEDRVAKLTAVRDDLQGKLEGVSLFYGLGPKDTPPFFGTDWQPKIPKIQQIVLEEYDRNNFDKPIARVDRCTSCHSGIDKPGFEDQPNPWKTHPNRDVLLAKHPAEKFGCTPCHEGQGPAVNSPAVAHGNFIDAHGELEEVHHIERPLRRGEKVQANCIKCHAGVQSLPGAEVVARGEKLFMELGCHGCHLTDGYEDLAKDQGVAQIGPSLRRIAAKVDKGWLVRWIRNPHQFRPRTRMPNFFPEKAPDGAPEGVVPAEMPPFVDPEVADDQSVKLAAYILSVSTDASNEWLAGHPSPGIMPGGDLAARGKELVDSIGCRGCHALSADEVAGQLGANKDIAPNLSRIAEKTSAQWIYHWIKNPRGYSSVARMPSLRLSEDEARAITAYVATLGEKQAAPAALEQKLADPENIKAGEKLVRKYGCFGCHDIPNMENESRIGVELSSFGGKTKEELFFGDRVDMPETWDDWTYSKLLTPRTYQTKWIEQAMPQFDLADEDIKALRVFLISRTDAKVLAKYRPVSPWDDKLVAGRRLVLRYNCQGCHVVEGQRGDIRRLYQEQPNFAPPILNGEGEKVQPAWLFNFVKAPVPIRPWLKLRMPTFGLRDDEANGIVAYFGALDHVQIPYVHLEKAAFKRDSVDAGRLLTTKDYFDCFSCHQRGAQKPQGPPEGWAPDLTLAHQRLQPEWILKWLTDPQKVMPGTKMPSFFPGGPPDVLGGDDAAQIRALRDYVISLGLPDTTPSPQTTATVTSPAPGASQ